MSGISEVGWVDGIEAKGSGHGAMDRLSPLAEVHLAHWQYLANIVCPDFMYLC